MDSSFSLRASVTEGIAACLAEHADWQGAVRSIRNWNPSEEGEAPAGLVCTLLTDEQADRAADWPFPVVDVIGQHTRPEIPTVTFDNRAIGAMAAAHLIERGYETLGYAGTAGRTFAHERREGFAARARRAGLVIHQHMAEGAFWSEPWAGRLRLLGEWLTTLPRPVGVMAVADWWASTLMEAANDADLAMPGDVAIVGVDNDPMYRDLSKPELSTVEPDARLRGYRAAELIITGRARSEADSIRISPLHVIERASTALYAIEDRAVAAALQFIHDSAEEPVAVDDVAAHVGVSRRNLEQRFSRHAGRTIHQAIWAAHLSRAQYLLRATDLSVLEVAVRSGFASHASLTNYFRRHVGMTPTEYRQGPRVPADPENR
jgi:LacI family transcriptional regulator